MSDTNLILPSVCFNIERAEALPTAADERLLQGIAGLDATKVNERERVGIAATLGLLACGEESAVHIFTRECKRAESIEALRGSARLLQQVADEEAVHDLLIKRLLARLPASEHLAMRKNSEARRFFIRLASPDPARHFFRIAELDAAVCIILGELLRGKGVGTRLDGIRHTLMRIVSDEARHVRISRSHISAMGVERGQFVDDADWVRSRLCTMIQGIGDAFDAVGADADRIVVKIMSRGLRPDGGPGLV
jgi:hypothetical protein